MIIALVHKRVDGSYNCLDLDTVWSLVTHVGGRSSVTKLGTDVVHGCH